MDDNKISIENFSRCCNKRESTIIRNKNKIPGLSYNKGQFDILKGTRYPAKLGNYKIETDAEKRYVLLKSINEYKYIDEDGLKLTKEQFDSMLNELLTSGLIKQNNLPNNFGANGYDITEKGSECIASKRDISMEKIAKVIESVAKIAAPIIAAVLD